LDVHHEEKFEFPLMRLIEQRAEEKDISILAAAKEVVPEYAAPLRWRDEEYGASLAKQQQEEIAANAQNSLLIRLKS
jgi:hypothetical protein